MPEAAQQLGRRRVGDQATATDDDEPVGRLLHLAHQVAGDEDGAPLVGQAPQQPADPQHAVEVETVDRLVEQEHLRVAEQRGGDAEPLPHPERVALDPPTGGAGEAHLLDDLVDAAHADAVGARGDAQVVATAATGVHGARVEQRAHHPQRLGEGAHAAAEHERLAAVGRSRPSTIRIVVDLPAPFGPRKPVTLPGSTSKLRSSTATTSP